MISVFELSDFSDRKRILALLEDIKDILSSEPPNIENSLNIINDLSRFVMNSFHKIFIQFQKTSLNENRIVAIEYETRKSTLKDYAKNIIVSSVTSAITAVVVTLLLSFIQNLSAYIANLIETLTLSVLLYYVHAIIYLIVFFYIVVYHTFWFLLKMRS